MAAPDVIEPEKPTTYRRWWNNPWNVVEAGGQNKAGDWTPADNQRLRALIDHAHANHLWIRFYTLDGATPDEMKQNGWFNGYNFGSLDAAKPRWHAAALDGADYIASDQYEQLGALIHSLPSAK
jgi:hypothetical protein